MIEAMINVFKTFPNIAFAYVFGSRVYGKTTSTSDYDVALLFKNDYGLDDLLDVTLRLAETLDIDLDSIDVIELNHAPVELAYDIIAKGKLVYCADDQLRVAFETRLMKEYIDLKPYFDAYYSLMFSRFSMAQFSGKPTRS